MTFITWYTFMKLVYPTNSQIQTLMTWFKDKQQFNDWAGPKAHYPFTPESFAQDLQIYTLKSFAMVDKDDVLIGFGQYYLRHHRCHLARLVISPDQRGKGLIVPLIQHLQHDAKASLGTTQSSLFVYQHNQAAIKAYQRLGFEVAQYPDDSMSTCIYMITTQSLLN